MQSKGQEKQEQTKVKVNRWEEIFLKDRAE
jgi:hypothetical protein